MKQVLLIDTEKGFGPEGMPDRELFQEAARQLCLYAIDGEKGRGAYGDKVYDAVTENRQSKRYSSCGDLAHWMLYRLGLRFPWINRREHHGWRSGVNVWRLIKFGRKHAENVGRSTLFHPGDVLQVGPPGNPFRDANGLFVHVSVVIKDHGPIGSDRILETADYGQPGGKLHDTKLVVKGSKLYRGKRECARVLRLWPSVLEASDQDLLMESEVPNNFVGGLELSEEDF